MTMASDVTTHLAGFRPAGGGLPFLGRKKRRAGEKVAARVSGNSYR
jgi:hypothetical protein